MYGVHGAVPGFGARLISSQRLPGFASAHISSKSALPSQQCQLWRSVPYNLVTWFAPS